MATPPGSRSVVRVPSGTGVQVAGAYAALPPRERVTFLEHNVARGETMGGIARRYGVSLSELREANPRARPTSLRVGQRLIIPTAGVTAARRAVAAADQQREVVRQAVGTTHVVRRGETLSEIADESHVTVAQLQAWNGLGRSTVIRAGQRLRVRSLSTSRVVATARPAAAPASARSLADGARTHLVQRGDTLSGIADHYGVSISAIRAGQRTGVQFNDPGRDQAQDPGVGSGRRERLKKTLPTPPGVGRVFFFPLVAGRPLSPSADIPAARRVHSRWWGRRPRP